MAYVEGDLLSEVIARGDLSVEKALDIVEQVCDGLGKAHEAGIVHRDIKPGNIFIDQDGRVKILDFGLATREGAPKLTRMESTVGTIYYMSPEQASGGHIDQRSDVFSLGVVLYELIAGQPPFTGDHTAAVLYSIANEDPQPVSRYSRKVTPELERIVSKALAKEPGDRYQSMADLAVDLRLVYNRSAALSGKSRAVMKFAIPTSVVFLAVILMLVFKPFRVEISPDQTAVAGDNKLAIMYFENMADREDARRLGEIVTDLLITNLSRTENLQVVSSQRLYDILKLKGQEGEKVIDRSTSTEVARAAGAKWMMLGRILQVEPTFIVSSQLIDMATGNVVTSQRVTGAPGETIFEIVDRMTGDTKGDLHVPREKGGDAEISVADVTTNSLEAYRYYLEGEEYSERFYRREAIESYRKAIAVDSSFAMAYLRLATESIQTSFQEAQSAITKAVEYSANATDKERLYIDGINAMFLQDDRRAVESFEEIVDRYPDEKDALSMMGNILYQLEEMDRAIETYEKVLELDPMDKTVYNQLAYSYQNVGEIDKAIWALDKYIELAPDEPNPYDSRGDIYAYSGRLEEAIESYKRALAIKPDFVQSVGKLGHMYLYQLDEDRAREQYRQLATSEVPAVRSTGRYHLANMFFYRGRMKEGIEQMDLGMAADEMEGLRDFTYIMKILGNSAAYTALEKFEEALVELRRTEPIFDAILPPDVPEYRYMREVGKAYSFAVNKRPERAKEILAELAPVIDEVSSEDVRKDYVLAQGRIAFEEGDFEAACKDFEKAEELSPEFQERYLLGVAFLEAGRHEESIEVLEKVVNRYDTGRITFPGWSAKVHYYIARAYEASGDHQKAVGQYEQFLRIWEDGDPELKEISEAKTRLEALRASG
jgi:tetratricopeptide (TPR) repeat protein